MNKVVVAVSAVVASLGLAVGTFFLVKHFDKKEVQINQAGQEKEESEVIVEEEEEDETK